MPGTSDRKDDHIRIVKEEDVETYGTGFANVHFVHEALPEIHLEDIDTSIDFLGHELEAPVVIESMTGGHPNTTKINRSLAHAAQETGIAMGVGSQRAGLEDEDTVRSYAVVREAAPDAFIYGNIGAAQLEEYGIEGVEEAVDMIDADAMAIHLNFLQEAVQPEGDIDARGCMDEIEKVAQDLSVPIIVKETGNGISRSTAEGLRDAGVDVIDVAGRGGTTWSGVEAYRAAAVGDDRGEKLGNLFRNWGIPTVVSTMEVSDVHPYVVASGGVRSGLDIAKAIAVGAQAGGLAKPFLKPAGRGKDEAIEAATEIISELRTAMFVTGSKNIDELRNAQVVITGKTREYLNQLRE
ncbi:MAG: type 2 isopentenyl-diphosphate Delta-isomerase [Halobacteria archaeon]|nr:type 2 isopentenyl-diphosphate Delta-isomerase [Halobacteria archaeon]